MNKIKVCIQINRLNAKQSWTMAIAKKKQWGKQATGFDFIYEPQSHYAAKRSFKRLFSLVLNIETVIRVLFWLPLWRAPATDVFNCEWFVCDGKNAILPNHFIMSNVHMIVWARSTHMETCSKFRHVPIFWNAYEKCDHAELYRRKKKFLLWWPQFIKSIGLAHTFTVERHPVPSRRIQYDLIGIAFLSDISALTNSFSWIFHKPTIWQLTNDLLMNLRFAEIMNGLKFLDLLFISFTTLRLSLFLCWLTTS